MSCSRSSFLEYVSFTLQVESNVKVEIEDEVKASGPGHGNIHEPLSTSVMIGGTQKTDTSKLDSDRCTFVDCNDVREGEWMNTVA